MHGTYNYELMKLHLLYDPKYCYFPQYHTRTSVPSCIALKLLFATGQFVQSTTSLVVR